jgi:hypothetical protein
MSTISSGTTLTTALVQTGDTTGDLVIKTGASNTTAMTVSGSNQNVGIGTASPTARLDITGSSFATANVNFAQRTDDTTVSTATTWSASSGNYMARNLGGALTFNSGNTIGSSAGTERMRIDSSGNVGIGTSSPLGTLGISGSATATIVIPRSSNGTTASPVETQLIASTFTNGTFGAGIFALNSFSDTSANFLTFKTTATGNGSPTERMRVDSSGNVGIGTTTPKLRLSGRVLSINGPDAGENYQSSIELLNNNASAGEIWTNTSEMVIGAFGAGRPLSFRVQNNTRGQFDTSGNFLFNSGYGSDPVIAYGCRAWVNFNGQSTVSIRLSRNVTSITDNGTGDYTVNLTTAMPDANYCVHLTADVAQQMVKSANIFGGSGTNPTASAVRVFTRDGGSSAIDASYVYVAITR